VAREVAGAGGENRAVRTARPLSAEAVNADVEHTILQSRDTQLIIHAIPPQVADSINIEVPPVARDEGAIKPFFTVADLAHSERVA